MGMPTNVSAARNASRGAQRAYREYAIVRRSDEADYLITALQIADLLPSLRLCFADIDWGVPIGEANAERHVTLPSIRNFGAFFLANFQRRPGYIWRYFPNPASAAEGASGSSAKTGIVAGGFPA